MDTPQESQQQGEPEDGARVASDGQPHDKGAPAPSVTINRIEAVGAHATHEAADCDGHEEARTPEKWWKGFWYDIKATDISLAVFTAILTFNSCRQSGLMQSANTITGSAATASQEAAKAAGNTYDLEVAGQESAAEALDATKKTAAATEITAKAAQKSADAAKATADGVARTAASITAAIELSKKANQTAERAAIAANLSASAAIESNRLNSEMSEKQLRAYVAVTGTSFKFNKAAQRVDGSIVLKNTGFTFAHNVRVVAQLVCVPIADNFYPAAAFDQPPAPSIGPGTEFVVQLDTDWQGTPPGQMKAWAEGTVYYDDEFGRPHTTSFRFIANRRPISATEFQMVLDSRGNHAN